MTIGSESGAWYNLFTPAPPPIMPAMPDSSPAIASDGPIMSRAPFAHQANAWRASLALFDQFGAAFWRMGIGSGKTFTAINLYRQMRSGRVDAAVIVCPKALIGTWEAQIAEHCVEPCAIWRWDATKAASAKAKSAFDYALGFRGARFFIFNVEGFSSVNDKMKAALTAVLAQKTLMVLDESSTIKTPYQPRARKGLRSGALATWGKKATYRIAMTGTEVTKSPLDVYQQAEFLIPGFWGEGFFMFKKRYAVLVPEYGAGGRTHDKIVGYQRIDELMAKLAGISYSVRTADVIDLPERTDEIITVELGPKTRRLYDELRKNLYADLESGKTLSTPSKIAAFTKLRQVSGGFVLDGDGEATPTGETDKLDALEALIEDTDEQIVIFANHRAEIAAIAERLGKIAPVVTFCGDGGDHAQAVKDFTDGSARFFVAHPASGGYGLNLQCAHIMVFYSIITRDFEQVIGRIRRSGQRNACLYYYMVARDTVDARLLDIVRTDSAMLSHFHAGDSQALMELLKK